MPMYLITRKELVNLETLRTNEFYPRIVHAANSYQAIETMFSPNDFQPSRDKTLYVYEIKSLDKFVAKPVNQFTIERFDHIPFD